MALRSGGRCRPCNLRKSQLHSFGIYIRFHRHAKYNSVRKGVRICRWHEFVMSRVCKACLA
eukprot:scaffold132140_cov38-Prasinocladus_malaysianus.AAC.1